MSYHVICIYVVILLSQELKEVISNNLRTTYTESKSLACSWSLSKTLVGVGGVTIYIYIIYIYIYIYDNKIMKHIKY